VELKQDLVRGDHIAIRPFNRTIVELKHEEIVIHTSTDILLIVPLWNWNFAMENAHFPDPAF